MNAETLRLFDVRRKMIARCYDSKDKSFHIYGGRGITVCKRWMADFNAFRADMGPRPKGATVERIDNDGPYSPENCKWATRTEQSRNTRRNKMISFSGKTLCLVEWAEQNGIKPNTLVRRFLAGWSIKQALTQPVRPR